jgi:hypothetical protein
LLQGESLDHADNVTTLEKGVFMLQPFYVQRGGVFAEQSFQNHWAATSNRSGAINSVLLTVMNQLRVCVLTESVEPL